ncbi:MAG: DUF4240 domain-containing protein [Cyanobacteriota/Melainabacteria group bacterium]|nr:DUF4240 domain-containing protein [Cyanobacteria bacterium HKST-UBA01]
MPDSEKIPDETNKSKYLQLKTSSTRTPTTKNCLSMPNIYSLFGKEVTALKDRWKNIDLTKIDFFNSPFGKTKEERQDFRGLCLTGSKDEYLRIENQRFENCDFSYAQFKYCEIVGGLFTGCKLVCTDFHSCIDSSRGTNNIREIEVSYQPPESNKLLKSLKKLIPDFSTSSFKATKLFHLQDTDLKRGGIYLFDLDSTPAWISLCILAEQIKCCKTPPPIIVLDQSDYYCCSPEEKQLLDLLYGSRRGGLGEIAWIKDNRIIKSSVLALTDTRQTIKTALDHMDSGYAEPMYSLPISDFWRLIEESLPSEGEYEYNLHSKNLESSLSQLDTAQLIAFEEFFNELHLQAYSGELLDAAIAIGLAVDRGCDDNDISEFLYGLILRGRAAYYSAIAEPEETLLKLEKAHFLLKEGISYIPSQILDYRAEHDADEGKDPNKQESNSAKALPLRKPGGIFLNDDKKTKKKYSRLSKKYRSYADNAF